MNRLNEKIVETLKQHPEGEAFFDALDAMVRGDMDILAAFMAFVKSKIQEPKYKTLLLTGQFGIALMDLYGNELKEMFDDVILVNGGIRSGKEPIIYRDTIAAPRCIMFDDSFYSGKTRDEIAKKIASIRTEAKILQTYVVYDGSIRKEDNVFSMFRYHKDPEPISGDDPFEL